MEAVHKEAAQDACQQAHAYIGEGELPAQKSPEQDYGDFIDDGRGYEEGHGDAQRDAGRGESKEERDAGAGAEGRDCPENCAKGIAQTAPLPLEVIAYTIGIQASAKPADDIDHEDEQEQYLGGIIEEELNGMAKGRTFFKAEESVRHPVGQRGDVGIGAKP